jgi:hypothetical protein
MGTRIVMQEQHHLLAEHFPDVEAVEREVTAWF